MGSIPILFIIKVIIEKQRPNRIGDDKSLKSLTFGWRGAWKYRKYQVFDLVDESVGKL